MYFIKMNARNCIVRSGAPDFSILNYDCHCQQFVCFHIPQIQIRLQKP